jgi:hypothetical protein
MSKALVAHKRANFFFVVPAKAGIHSSAALEFRTKGNVLPALVASGLGEMDPGFRRGDEKICGTGFRHFRANGVQRNLSKEERAA